MAAESKLQVVTANRLKDGRVVYLAREGEWSRRVEDGWVGRDEAEVERLMALASDAVDRCRVVGPYPIDVIVEDGRIRPVRLREVIRAEGPTVAAAPATSPGDGRAAFSAGPVPRAAE